MCGKRWDSLVEVQHLADDIHAGRRGASQGPGVGVSSETCGVEVQCHMLLMRVVVAAARRGLQLGSYDLPRGRGEARSTEPDAPLAGGLCCIAMMEPRAAEGSGGNYLKK